MGEEFIYLGESAREETSSFQFSRRRGVIEAEALSSSRTTVCLFGCGDGLSEAVTRRSLSDGLR